MTRQGGATGATGHHVVVRAVGVVLAVAAVLLVGAVAILQLVRPAAAPGASADTSPASAPASNAPPAPPEVVAQGSPAGWTDDWGLCGLPIGQAPAGGTIPFAVTTAGLPSTRTVGETWTGDVSARPPLGTPTELQVVGSIALLDGIVVGVPRTPPVAYLLTAASEVPVDLTVPGDLASCIGAPAGTGGTDTAAPLAAGRYEIVVLLRSTDGGRQTTAVAAAGALTVTGKGGAARPTAPSSVLPPISFSTPMDQAACATDASSGSSAHRTRYPSSVIAGAAQLVDGSLVATVTVLNTGRSLRDASIGPVDVQVLRDGKVVGEGQTSALPVEFVGQWASGASVDASVDIGPLTCPSANSEPWTPGSYELYATVSSSWGSDAETSAAGGPWTFVVP